MAIKPCTFNFKARPGNYLPWDAITQYGQTVKVILDGKTHDQVMRSAWGWNRKMRPSIAVRVIIRAQTFLIFEAYKPIDKSDDIPW